MVFCYKEIVMNNSKLYKQQLYLVPWETGITKEYNVPVLAWAYISRNCKNAVFGKKVFGSCLQWQEQIVNEVKKFIIDLNDKWGKSLYKTGYTKRNIEIFCPSFCYGGSKYTISQRTIWQCLCIAANGLNIPMNKLYPSVYLFYMSSSYEASFEAIRKRLREIGHDIEEGDYGSVHSLSCLYYKNNNLYKSLLRKYESKKRKKEENEKQV